MSLSLLQMLTGIPVYTAAEQTEKDITQLKEAAARFMEKLPKTPEELQNRIEEAVTRTCRETEAVKTVLEQLASLTPEEWETILRNTLNRLEEQAKASCTEENLEKLNYDAGDVRKIEDAAEGVIGEAAEEVVEKNLDDVAEAAIEGGKTIDDIINSLDETTNGKGIARNFESSGGFDQTLKDFDSLNPVDVKDIQAKYGPGKVGNLSDGIIVVARPGSTTGGTTLEIRVSNSKVYKIRY